MIEFMTRLAPFFPAIVVFVGALLVAFGGFLASYRQSNFNAEIREKNEEIARLQRENASAITGGDSFAYAGFQIFATDGGPVNAHAMPEDLLLIPAIVHQGKYPLYDVTVRFVQLDKPLDQDSLRTYPVGNLTPGLANISSLRLRHHGRDIKFNVFFTARNGIWLQTLRMLWVGNGWAVADRVTRGKEEVFREVANNFPRRDDGTVDWDETGVPAERSK